MPVLKDEKEFTLALRTPICKGVKGKGKAKSLSLEISESLSPFPTPYNPDSNNLDTESKSKPESELAGVCATGGEELKGDKNNEDNTVSEELEDTGLLLAPLSSSLSLASIPPFSLSASAPITPTGPTKK